MTAQRSSDPDRGSDQIAARTAGKRVDDTKGIQSQSGEARNPGHGADAPALAWVGMQIEGRGGGGGCGGEGRRSNKPTSGVVERNAVVVIARSSGCMAACLHVKGHLI